MFLHLYYSRTNLDPVMIKASWFESRKLISRDLMYQFFICFNFFISSNMSVLLAFVCSISSHVCCITWWSSLSCLLWGLSFKDSQLSLCCHAAMCFVGCLAASQTCQSYTETREAHGAMHDTLAARKHRNTCPVFNDFRRRARWLIQCEIIQ